MICHLSFTNSFTQIFKRLLTFSNIVINTNHTNRISCRISLNQRVGLDIPNLTGRPHYPKLSIE